MAKNEHLPLSGPSPTPLSIFSGVSILRDTEGRPLGEQNIDLGVLKGVMMDGVVPFELEPSNFPDSPSRYPDGRPHVKPRELSAFEQTRNYFPQMIVCMEFLKNYVRLERGDREETQPISLLDAFMTIQMARAAPFYLVSRRRDRLPPDRIPPVLSVMFKSLSGVSLSLRRYMNAQEAAGVDIENSPLHPTVDNLMAFIERENLLIGRQFVCAAPTAMIRATLSALFDSQPFDRQGKIGPVPYLLRSPKGVLDEIEQVAWALSHFEKFSFPLQRQLRDIKRTIAEIRQQRD